MHYRKLRPTRARLLETVRSVGAVHYLPGWPVLVYGHDERGYRLSFPRTGGKAVGVPRSAFRVVQ